MLKLYLKGPLKYEIIAKNVFRKLVTGLISKKSHKNYLFIAFMARNRLRRIYEALPLNPMSMSSMDKPKFRSELVQICLEGHSKLEY